MNDSVRNFPETGRSTFIDISILSRFDLVGELYDIVTDPLVQSCSFGIADGSSATDLPVRDVDPDYVYLLFETDNEKDLLERKEFLFQFSRELRTRFSLDWTRVFPGENRIPAGSPFALYLLIHARKGH